MRLVFAILLLSAAVPGTTGIAAGLSDKTRQRIDSLLRYRLKPDPLPVDLPNPFLVIRGNIGSAYADGSLGVSPAEGESGGREKTARGSAEMLARYAAGLRIGGVVWLNNQMQVVINELLRKEGDFVILDRDNATIRIQVAGIRPGRLILRLGDAEHTVRF